jgi:hypothetical protein
MPDAPQLVPEYCLCSPYSQQMCFQMKREIDLRTGKSLFPTET